MAGVEVREIEKERNGGCSHCGRKKTGFELKQENMRKEERVGVRAGAQK